MIKYYGNFFIFIFILNVLLCSSDIFAEKTLTIPALREWKDSTAEFIFNSSSRIIIDQNYAAQLASEAQTFREDIDSLKGIELQIVNNSQTKSGDIYLTMNSTDKDIGNEGYTILISDIIVINAKTKAGVFYGTRTVLQLLKNSNNVKSGFARDWPQYKERGMMIDNGRKYFSVNWLENHIKELAYLKMNIFHFHISHDEGFRLECESHPEITSTQYYTKAEIRSLQKLADKYHVIIIPEIDMPGHMGAILSKYQTTFALKDKNGGIWGGNLDVSSEDARSFVKDIILEYLELFTGPYWHLGADEFIIDDFSKFPQLLEFSQKKYGINAEPKDAIFDFINWADSIVISKGKTMRIWNDYLVLGLDNKSTIQINKDIIVEFWISDFSPKNQTQELLDLGYTLVNCNIDILYYTFGQGWKWQNQPLYEKWEPNIFEYNRVVAKDHPGVLGAKFQVWCDNPPLESEGVVAIGIRKALRVVSQSFWDSPKLVSTFSNFDKIIDSLGQAPGVNFPDNPMPDNLVFRKRVVASSMEKGTVYKPELVIDGCYDTRWSSDYSDNEWIYVDLEKSYNITRVKLNWAYTYPLNYQIQTSDDTTNWKTIYSTEAGSIDIRDLTNLSGKGRYVRIYCSKRLSDSVGYSLWEFEVYDSILISSDYHEPIESNNDDLLECYPNPANNSVFINYKLNVPSNVKLVICDLNGKEIFELENVFKSEGIYKIKFNTETFANGEYYCSLFYNNKIISKKLIILKQ
jgi:hexosaminidase